MHLLAETSGKNAIVITQAADLDLAIRDLVQVGVRSRRAEVLGGEPGDRRGAAVRRRAVHGPAGRRHTQPGRRPAQRPRQRRRSADRRPVGEAATRLSPNSTAANGGSSSRVSSAATCGHPGVRVGVRPGSWFHVTECFGPVLGVMRADDLDHAIDVAERDAVRPHRRHPLARRGRGRPLARRRAGRQRLHQPWHHRGDRAAPTVRRMEAIVGRAAGRRRAVPTTSPRWSTGTAVGHRSATSPNGRIGMRGRSGSAAATIPRAWRASATNCATDSSMACWFAAAPTRPTVRWPRLACAARDLRNDAWSSPTRRPSRRLP